VAAAAAPNDDRDEFLALVDALGCRKRKVQDLLEKGELWSNWKERVKGTERDDTLASFFDYCKREMRSPEAISPVSPVATVPQGNKFFFSCSSSFHRMRGGD
jgi:hypothetical protein